MICFLILEGVSGYIYTRKILYDTGLIMLERTMYLAIILLLLQDRFHNH